MTRALAARTWSELRDLLADLPATRLAPQARPPGPPVPSRGRCPGASHPLIAVLAGIGITTAMLVNVTQPIARPASTDQAVIWSRPCLCRTSRTSAVLTCAEQCSRSSRFVLRTATTRGFAPGARRRHCPGNASTMQEKCTQNTRGAYSEDAQIRTPDTADICTAAPEPQAALRDGFPSASVRN